MCYFTSFWAGVLINLKTLLYPITESVTEDKLLFLSSKDTKSIQMNSPNTVVKDLFKDYDVKEFQFDLSQFRSTKS